MDRDVSEILTSSECYPELLNVCKPWKWATATTTTSVPTVLMVTDFKPQFMGSLTWRSIRMYASSCEHGWSPSVFWHSCPRNRKSSSSCHHFIRSLFFQFPGSLAWLDTRLRLPVPLFALVASFRLSFMYTSQTRSTRWVYPIPKTHVGWIRPFPIRRRFSNPRLEKYAQHHPGLLLPHEGILVTAESPWVSRNPTRSDPPVSVSQMKTVLEDISDFRAWNTSWYQFLWKPNTWILSGMYTWRTVWNFKQGQTEGQEHASECLAMPSFQRTGKTSYEMMTIRMNSSSSSEKSVLPWTHETRSSYPPYWTVSLALEMVRIQTDFKHAHTKRLTPRCLYMSKTPSRWW